MEKQNLQFEAQDKGGIKGLVTFKNYLLDSARARLIAKILETAVDISAKEYEKLIGELTRICQTREIVRENLVVLSGRAVIARRLIGDLTYSGTVNYGALGTSSTAVSSAQTQLVAEVARKLYARRTRTNAQCNFDFFYSQADTNGTYQEFGLFIDGTSAANSGQMFNRVLTGGWTKTSVEAMTVSIQININDS